MNAEQYIRRVEKALSASRSTRKAVARDLREAFASAAEHGENEQQVIRRLGTPADFAANVRESLAPANPFENSAGAGYASLYPLPWE